MSFYIEFTHEQLTQMANSYKDGKTVAELEEKYGISNSAVRSRLKYMGVTMRAQGKRLGTKNKYTKGAN